jgi:hypothetical protein
MDAKPEANAFDSLGVRDAGRSPSRHLPYSRDSNSGAGTAKAEPHSNAVAEEAAVYAAAMDVAEANAVAAAATGDDGDGGGGGVDPAELELYIERYDGELMQWLQVKMDAFDEKPQFRASRIAKYGSREHYETALCSSVAVRLRQARIDYAEGVEPPSPLRA